jgi:hypothetical protein
LRSLYQILLFHLYYYAIRLLHQARSGDKDKKPDSLADRTSHRGVFWAAHQRNLPYVQIDRPVNLGSLPPFGFRVASFPLKTQDGSAGSTRALTILPDGSGVVPESV